MVEARQPRYRVNPRAGRVLAIVGNTLVDTATIESTAAAQRLGMALHLQGKLRAADGFAADGSFATKRPAAFGYWREVQRATFRDRAEHEVDYGKVAMRVTIEAPGEFRVWRGSTPDIPPRRRESIYVELAAPAEAATFKTTFAPRE